LFSNTAAALGSIYPEHKWEIWKFPTVPRDYWSNLANQREYFDWLSRKLGIKNYEDWYNVTVAMAKQNCRNGYIYSDIDSWSWCFGHIRRFPFQSLGNDLPRVQVAIMAIWLCSKVIIHEHNVYI
jgi:hypothetical protein